MKKILEQGKKLMDHGSHHVPENVYEMDDILEEEVGDTISTATPQVSNLTKEGKRLKKLAHKFASTEKKLERTTKQLEEEQATKRKLYQSMVKLAKELKVLREEQNHNLEVAKFQSQKWYDGGVWRCPDINPRVVADPEITRYQREPVSLTDLFFDLITITAFTRVGDQIARNGEVSYPTIAYFAVFWFIWMKESSYSTRFGTSDFVSQLETLLTCFAVLYGTFSISNDFMGADSTGIMTTALIVAVLHFLLHVRIFFWFMKAEENTYGLLAKKYASFTMIMLCLEIAVWLVGIFAVPEDSSSRWVIFVCGILCSTRLPRVFLTNDFHAASSKRGVLFLLQLGFLLQNVILVASPFFEYERPTTKQYIFLGSTCFLLFCIKLLYVSDTISTDPKDHALIVNRFAGFLFQFGQFTLLFSTTTLGSGLDLLTHSYLASTASLSGNSRKLVIGGFSAVILSIFIIKSMHVRRVPVDRTQKSLFYTAYAIEATVFLAIVFSTAFLAYSSNTNSLGLGEMDMLLVLSGLASFAVVISWLDEAIEMSLFDTSSDAQNYRVSATGFFSCCLGKAPEISQQDTNGNDVESSSLSSPLMMDYHAIQDEEKVNEPSKIV